MRVRTPSELGALIRDYRTRRNLDQKSLAATVGVSRPENRTFALVHLVQDRRASASDDNFLFADNSRVGGDKRVCEDLWRVRKFDGNFRYLSSVPFRD
jgi:hypothetical protein